jgi:hypothetical protein
MAAKPPAAMHGGWPDTSHEQEDRRMSYSIRSLSQGDDDVHPTEGTMTHDELKGLLRDQLIKANVIPTTAERLADMHAFRILRDSQGRIRTYADAAGTTLHPHDADDELGALVQELAVRVSPTEKGGMDHEARIAAVVAKQKSSGIYGM